ncbi:MAG TPA: N-acetylmuramoyl-L-alanine amidase [Gemmatimonadota bacterium]|nr:N-acetylmuramoyl-L-alanine amidase [Gemmatimonadota bacterium]
MLLIVALGAGACGGGVATGGPGAPGGADGPGGPGEAFPSGVIGGVLPPIPEVTGPVEVYVEYPDSLQRITASDSNFIFGNVGTGDAALTINGDSVEVNPNGTFLGWLPVPERVADTDSASYLLVARRGAEVDSLRHWILLPRRPFEGEPGTAWIDPGSLEDRPVRWALPDEVLELTVRASPGAVVWLDVGAASYEMSEIRRSGVYRYVTPAGMLHDVACARIRCGVGVATDADTLPPADSLRARVRVEFGGETAQDFVTIPLRILDPLRPLVAELREPPEPAGGADGIIVARPAPSGTYRWLLPDGTRAVVDGRLGGMWRIRLAPDLEAWVTEDDMRLLPPDTPPPTTRVGDLRFEVRDDRLTLTTWLAAAVPFDVEQPDPRTLELTMYGVTGLTDRIAEGAGGRLIERVEWRQLPGDRYRLRIGLHERVWGWRASWQVTAAGGAVLTFDIRRPPEIDPENPLRGRKIAIDPGHPGAGAHGPSGYYEGDANLGIGRALARMVREAGAEPVLIRDDTLPIGLYERTTAAMDAGAELFVSIHNNALPDGVQPIGREGTSTYHYHPHSHDLAVAVQEGMLATMGLRDLGVYWGDLAVTRMSWMPSVLAEGAFMMIPSHEAALMTPEFQAAYARGVLDGIEAFLRSVAEDGERR